MSEDGVKNSRHMISEEYSTCQLKVEGNLEVVGGAGVSRVGESSVFSS